MTTETRIKIDSLMTIAGFAFALLVQTATIVWWASGVSSRVDAINEVDQAQSQRLERVEQDTQRMAVGAATVAAQLQAVRDSLVEVKSSQAEILRLLSKEVQK